jgi:hypothetical protein
LVYGDNVVKLHWDGSFCGSGCYLGERLVLAAAHQFENGSPGEVTVELRSGARLAARLIASDKRLDAAVVELERMPPIRLPTVQIAESVSVGDRCYSLGWGNTGDDLKCFEGTVRKSCGDHIHTTSDIRSGDSGGPLFLADGRLIGTMLGAPNWRGKGPVHSDVSVALPCRPLRRFLGSLLARLDCHRPGPTPLPGPVGNCPCPLVPVPDPQIPPPSCPPIQIDYERLADLVYQKILADADRFRGPAGQDGGTVPIDLDDLAAKVAARLPPLTFQAVDSQGQPAGEPVSKRLGETLKLKTHLVELPSYRWAPSAPLAPIRD